MAKLLVVGGTGLIGSEVVRQARTLGHVVTMLSRDAKGIDGRVIVGDLRQPHSLEGLLRGEHFDAIVYLAQAASHNAFPGNATDAVAVNISAPVALCQWAVNSGCDRFILGSSGGICGPAHGLERITESSGRQPPERLNFYLSTKARCEELLVAFGGLLKIDVLRYFFVYGRTQRPDFLFPRLIEKMKSGQAIELAGGEGPWLNPIHARDAASLTIRALESSVGGVTNVAGLEDMTLRALVGALEQAVGTRAKVVPTDERPPRFLADTSLMLKKLGTPEITLDKGIAMSFAQEPRE
ncbi:NAD(P)-dependent oxidoreductase [Ramlibacter tataouinensis]|uniref:NAD-dependent epimerase/dehydratase family protein n=1 Tax=Ramlibacter tataouinensis TaxID=94132 RepID=UPI0022F3B1B3|nr:NAD(P)-dependent oxidoreductase [Ramlibacter tataouinensis]WBY00708.1 NAD(P)-dependent oxidoreductase [Ramlibacter tataouinensis]